MNNLEIINDYNVQLVTAYFCFGAQCIFYFLLVFVQSEIEKFTRGFLCAVLLCLGFIFFNVGGKIMTGHSLFFTASTLAFVSLLMMIFTVWVTYLYIVNKIKHKKNA
jgi:uncharacterized membrane protein